MNMKLVSGAGLAIILSIVHLDSFGQRTVGVTYNSGDAFDGYTLFSPAATRDVYLIDNCGGVVNQWSTTRRPGNSVYLSNDGFLYRAGQVENEVIFAGGAGGIIEKFDWDGNLVWEYTYNSDQVRAHHDFQVLENGNVLILAWESYSKVEAIENGRDPSLLVPDFVWPEHIVEVEQVGSDQGNIVWEWRAWDHLIQDFDSEKLNYGVVADHPEKININYMREGKIFEDWMHANAINYNADLDQIMLSVLFFDEIWIIDHNTTTEEAQGIKGDLLYRWGNPESYDRGDATDKQLFGQHNAQWIPAGYPDAGKILIFNNGQDRFENEEDLFTEVVKIDAGNYELDVAGEFLPEDFDWVYRKDPATDFYSRFISGAQQQPNGNVLINDGAHGVFFEVNPDGDILWKYVNPVTNQGILEQGSAVPFPNTNTVFRAERYAADHPAFTGKNLIATATLETNSDYVCGPLEAKPKLTISVFPNPANNVLNIIGAAGQFRLIDMHGRLFKEGDFHNLTSINISDLNDGLYILSVNGQYMEKIIISR